MSIEINYTNSFDRNLYHYTNSFDTNPCFQPTIHTGEVETNQCRPSPVKRAPGAPAVERHPTTAAAGCHHGDVPRRSGARWDVAMVMV